MKLRPEEITAVLKSQILDYEAEVDMQEVGTVVMVGDGDRPHPRPGERRRLRDARVAPRREGAGPEPRGGQRRRRPHGRGHPDQGGRRGQPDRCRHPGARGRGAHRPGHRSAGQPAGRQGPRRDHRVPGGRVQGARRHPAPAGEGAPPDRDQGHRLHDPHRPGTARADHRRPRHGQDGHRRGYHHQPEGPGRRLRLRGHRAEGLHGAAGGGEAGRDRRDGLHHRRHGLRLLLRSAPLHRALRRLRHGASSSPIAAGTPSASTTT